jgi:hypothetical protein
VAVGVRLGAGVALGSMVAVGGARVGGSVGRVVAVVGGAGLLVGGRVAAGTGAPQAFSSRSTAPTPAPTLRRFTGNLT